MNTKQELIAIRDGPPDNSWMFVDNVFGKSKYLRINNGNNEVFINNNWEILKAHR